MTALMDAVQPLSPSASGRGAGWSLGARLVALFGGLVAAIGVFMLVFFPSRMEASAQASAEARAASIARVMSTAIAPALEFEDFDNARSILGWLESMPDGRFGALRDASGAQVASWGRVPDRDLWPAEDRIELDRDLLLVTVPVVARGGASGTLHLGFSLSGLAAERDTTRMTVGLATTLVFVAGVFATALLAALVVRPMRRLTQTALKISRGELPPQLPRMTGGAELAEMADALRAMLERVHSVSQQELMRASRHAGMAEVATGVLHNVGNVLTAVNVSVELMRERADALPVDRLRRLQELLGTAASLDADRVAAVTRYVAAVTEQLGRAREEALRDIETLRKHVEHMKRVVAMQNAYARRGGVLELTAPAALLDEAIEIGCPAARRGALEISAEGPAQPVLLDRHRVLQIVVNLITNARDAVAATAEKRILVQAELRADEGADGTGGALVIRVSDTGMGIAPDQIDRVFKAGFTTKRHGHGYGLHSSALAAHQLEGSLVVESDGPGRGATFTLSVPAGERTKGRHDDG